MGAWNDGEKSEHKFQESGAWTLTCAEHRGQRDMASALQAWSRGPLPFLMDFIVRRGPYLIWEYKKKVKVF